MEETCVLSHEEYTSALKQFIEDIFDNFEEVADTYIIPSVIEYCGKLKELQRNESVGTVHCISMSFMNTALYFDRPCFQVEAYGEDWRLYLSPLFTDEIRCDWILPYWMKFRATLTQLADMHEVKKDQTTSQIEQTAWRGIGPAISMVASLLKYRVRPIAESMAYQHVRKALPFRLEIGEYLDWKLPLIALQEEIDIFNSFGTNYAYFTFNKKVYKGKMFTKLNLTHAVFENCAFDESVFTSCTLNDCIFRNCTFTGVRIENCLLPGSAIENCKLSHTSFINCIGSTAEMDPKQIKDFYLPFCVRDSSCHQVSFENCGLSYCGIVNCTTTYVTVTNCRTESSLFETYQTE